MLSRFPAFMRPPASAPSLKTIVVGVGPAWHFNVVRGGAGIAVDGLGRIHVGGADPAPAPSERPKLHPFRNADSYKEWLERHGFEKIGGGWYASVYAKPGSPWVLKIGSSPDDGWPAYARLVIDRHAGNPYAPNIKSLRWHGDADSPFYVAVMERLAEVVSKTDKGVFDFEARRWEGASAAWTLYQRANRALRDDDVVALRLMNLHQPELFRLVKDINDELLPASNLDFHEHNAMVDASGQRMVITDPISSTTLNTRQITRRSTARAIAA